MSDGPGDAAGDRGAGGERPAGGDRPRPHPLVDTAWFDTEAVVYDGRAQQVHRFNAAAAAVWLLCDGATGVDSMAAELASTFGLGDGEAAALVAEAVTRFAALGLLDDPLAGGGPKGGNASRYP